MSFAVLASQLVCRTPKDLTCPFQDSAKDTATTISWALSLGRIPRLTSTMPMLGVMSSTVVLRTLQLIFTTALTRHVTASTNRRS